MSLEEGGSINLSLHFDCIGAVMIKYREYLMDFVTKGLGILGGSHNDADLRKGV